MNEEDRIQKMREYILLADRLQDRIDNPGMIDVVNGLSRDLKCSMQILEIGQRLLQKLDDLVPEPEKEEFSKQKKKIPEYSSEYEPYIASAKAKAYGFAACIAACFSRELSKSLLQKKDEYNKKNRDLAQLICLDRKIKDFQDKSVRLASEREFEEARYIESLREKLPMDDEMAYDLINQPELMVYAKLEILKRKYAPEL